MSATYIAVIEVIPNDPSAYQYLSCVADSPDEVWDMARQHSAGISANARVKQVTEAKFQKIEEVFAPKTTVEISQSELQMLVDCVVTETDHWEDDYREEFERIGNLADLEVKLRRVAKAAGWSLR